MSGIAHFENAKCLDLILKCKITLSPQFKKQLQNQKINYDFARVIL